MPDIPIKLRFNILGCLLLLSLVTTACSVLGGSGQASTPTPMPTSSVPDLQVIAPEACLVAQQDMIRVNDPQGDLISWSPSSDTVAYIAAAQRASWNVGDLDQVSAPKFDSPVRLATGAAGELSWAPDASSIAYLGLRRSDNLYTIGLAYPDGRASVDLFPDEAARTDDYSSQKAILEWMDATRLRVMVSCGVDCLQTMDFDVQTGNSSLVGDAIQPPWELYSPHTFHPSILPDEYAQLAGQLNWSWDDQLIAYIDDIGNAWVINPADGTLYPLGIGQYGTATETDWSYDSQYLAVHVDQTMMIFSFNCP